MKSFTLNRPLTPLLVVIFLGVAGCGGNQGSGAGPGSSRGSDLRVLTATEIEALGAVSTMTQLLGSMPGVLVGGSGVQLAGRGGPPLFVIDGVPAGSASAGLSLNPRDIARIAVLVDSAELSAYGIRGANGVILINTR